MNFKRILTLVLACCWNGPMAFGFVHIHQLKPHLAVSPEQPLITFYWNGAAPSLRDKDKVLDGAFANASDKETMEALLKKALATWVDVPTAYIEFELLERADLILDSDDETFSIVVATPESKLVAAAAVPSFITRDPSPSELEKNDRIIHDCDISVSDAKVEAKSLLRTLTHEIGHCLGLGHPHSTYRSIMSYASIDDSASLTLDDEAGVSFLYPEVGQSQKVVNLASIGGCGTVGGLGAGSPLLLYLVLALPIGVGLWRRNRQA